MHTKRFISALILGSLLCAPTAAFFHGGTYTGPGDTVPPGGGGGGGGGGSRPTPGGGGPGIPGTGGPPSPTTPRPGSPGNPGGGPSAGPSTGGGGATNDWTDWQYWWAFNRAPYLDLKSRVQGGATTGDDGFFIGFGQERTRGVTFAPSRATLDEKVLPALVEAILNERDNDVVTAAMVAAAKIGDSVGEDGESAVSRAISTRLTDPVQEIAETAVLSLGIHASPAALDEMIAIARDDAAGRRLIGKPESPINQRTRSFATYSLGLIGHANSDTALRSEVVQVLFEILEGPREATRDVKVAAAISIGIIPIDPLERVGELESAQPWDSRRDQIEALIALHDAGKQSKLRDAERAHLGRSMVRLCDGAPADLRDAVGESLIAAVGNRTRTETVALRQSAVLALGQLGDCDKDPIDVKIRAALLRGLKDPDPQVQAFSLIAMGQVGGQVGDEPADEANGRSDLRRTLSSQLANGKRRRPWAALAIGVMERELAEAGAAVSPEQLAALDMALSSTRSGHDVSAYALALGIARSEGHASTLMDQLDSQSEDIVRGHIAVGLGMMNATGATEQIQEIVSKSKYRATLLEQSAIALGLLGDRGVAGKLAVMLRDEAKSLASQAAIASALGFIGDSGSIDPLLDMLHDDSLTDRARAFAIAALGIVGDKEPLPWNSKLSVDLNYRASASTLVEGGKGVIEIL
jgi:HEAT repeat protein